METTSEAASVIKNVLILLPSQVNSMSDLPFGDTISAEYVLNLLLVDNKEIFDSQFIF